MADQPSLRCVNARQGKAHSLTCVKARSLQSGDAAGQRMQETQRGARQPDHHSP